MESEKSAGRDCFFLVFRADESPVMEMFTSERPFRVPAFYHASEPLVGRALPPFCRRFRQTFPTERSFRETAFYHASAPLVGRAPPPISRRFRQTRAF